MPKPKPTIDLNTYDTLVPWWQAGSHVAAYQNGNLESPRLGDWRFLRVGPKSAFAEAPTTFPVTKLTMDGYDFHFQHTFRSASAFRTHFDVVSDQPNVTRPNIL